MQMMLARIEFVWIVAWYVRLLEQKLAEAKSKKDTLKARAQSAKTSKQVQEMVSGVGTSNSLAAFERMEEKVMRMEAESDAIGQISSGSSGLEAQFAALEAGNVDDELAMMKKQITGDVPKQASTDKPKPVTDSIDAELEELRRKAKEL